MSSEPEMARLKNFSTGARNSTTLPCAYLIIIFDPSSTRSISYLN
jgi:hypothetical protein